MGTDFSRRAFLRGAAGLTAAAAGGCCSCRCTKPPRVVKQGDKIRLGVIGAGGKGLSDWTCIFKHGEEIAAFCDVDDKMVDEALAELQKLGRGRVVRGADSIYTIRTQYLELAFQCTTVHGGAEGTHVVVHAYAPEFPHLPVQAESFVRTYLNAPYSESGADLVKQYVTVF